jgi:hypothetical protein
MKAPFNNVQLTYRDSEYPGTISMSIRGRLTFEPPTVVNMSAQQAVELARRLLHAVDAEGYDLTARKRADR